MKDENKTKKQLINELIESRKEIIRLQKAFNKFRKTADHLEKESDNVSMELAISLSEVFEALKKISSGDPEVSISEESEVGLISQLKHMVNITAQNIGEIVDQSHEFAISLAEQFDVLKRVSKGDLKARVTGISRVELLEFLKGVTNEMIESVSRAEEDLRLSEEKYRTVFENTGAATVIVEEGIISLANREFERLTGYSKEEIEGRKRWTEFLARNDLERMEEYYRSWLVDPDSVPGSCECRLTDRHGSIKDVFVTMAMIPGTRIGVASLLNITERKKAEETIMRLSHQNELILDSAGEGIFGLDLEGDHTFVNPSAAKMLGYGVQELIGNPSHTIWHHTKADGSPYPEDECPIYAAYKKGLTYRMTDEVFWRKDGTSFFVEYTSTPIFEGDSLTGAVVAFNDITERKKSENMILKINRTLKVLSSCNEILIRSKDEMELLNSLCTTIVELGEYRMCRVDYAEYGIASILRPVAYAGCGDDHPETLKETWPDRELDQKTEGEAVRTGKAVICNNIMTDPQFEHWRDEAAKCGYTSAIVLPLAENSGSLGVLVIYASEPDAFDQDETGLLTQLANDLAYGIVSLRTRTARRSAEEALKKGEVELKKRVKELEEFYDIAVGRELRMKELKEEIESLKEELEKYKKS